MGVHGQIYLGIRLEDVDGGRKTLEPEIYNRKKGLKGVWTKEDIYEIENSHH